MENKDIAKNILHAFDITTKCKGYYCILIGIDLMTKDESIIDDLTKVFYIEIAKICNIEYLCVEKNIRYVINRIWSEKTKNKKNLILKIFGINYLNKKPSNKIFMELMYHYIKNYNSNKYVCPLYECECMVYKQIIGNLNI